LGPWLAAADLARDEGPEEQRYEHEDQAPTDNSPSWVAGLGDRRVGPYVGNEEMRPNVRTARTGRPRPSQFAARYEIAVPTAPMVARDKSGNGCSRVVVRSS
jgi:hypothetical protein